MSKPVENKSGQKNGRQAPKGIGANRLELVNPEVQARREKYFEYFVAALLLAFGIYHSIHLFGYTIVPNSDFPSFFLTGKEILSLKVPSSFKRGPVLGIIQVCLSKFINNQHPDLTSGWLLNAILHPFNLLLFLLVGKKIVGKAAPWFALVAIINPQVVYLLTEPIAETTFLFFILLTTYLIFKRSNWCYFFASLATMTRYEGAALILGGFVLDIITRTGKRERVRALLYSIAASTPLIIWLLGTVANWQGENYLQLFGKEYSKLYAVSAEERTGFGVHLRVLWQTAFYPLLMPYPGASGEFVKKLFDLSMVFAGAGFLTGSIIGLWKRNWNILVLLLFIVPYFVIHIKFPSPLLRYDMPIFWTALLISLYGFINLWKVIDRDGRVPKMIVIILQSVIVIAAAAWAISIGIYLPKIAQTCPGTVFLPYAAVSLAGLIFAGRMFISSQKDFLKGLSIFAVICLIIVSNQFVLAQTLGDGQREIEFKMLGEWFAANAKPNEKMAVYQNDTQLFAGKYAQNVIGFPKAENPKDLVDKLRKNEVIYVVWATREGYSRDHTGYRQLGLDKNIAFLEKPHNIGCYEFITQVGNKKGYVNIFRLKDRGEEQLPN